MFRQNLNDDDDGEIALAYDDEVEFEEEEYHGDDLRGQEYDQEFDNDDSAPQIGNFWSNHRRGIDPIPSASRRRHRPLPPSIAAPHHRPPKNPGARTTFQPGTPAPPGPVKDLYDRILVRNG